MKSKIKLKYSRDYQKVYIENELTSEARVQLSNMMTVLNGIVVVNGKIQKRANNTRGREYDNVNGQRRPEREEWTPVQGRHFRGRSGREQVYMYQNIGKLYICGDFNSRCGDAQDFMKGVDNVQIREIVDSVSNRNGDLLIEFLVDCNMCMVNGRIGSQDFTHIKGTGKSVVDYVLTPHEQLNEVINFKKVNTMSDLVTELSLVGYESIPDHSLLEWGMRVRKNGYVGSRTKRERYRSKSG
ncbi:Hypothetical predicted protein [Mytilus galloprovincialis]|uniref:Endonuclease/exonuclease/phosphatase domain-containing protein n=1 Tax=Mytilus galloprovincialis TaxID=29158 RepID=A0A8B6G3T5_MYTGA|nr:Hypothetical predicted protein [Mytilus galloprovincialis]